MGDLMNGDKKEDFNQIKSELISEIKGMRQDMNRLFDTVQFHDQALYGNKSDKPGAMEDVRFLKTAELTRQKHTAWVWTAIIAGAIERIFHYFTGAGPK